MKTLILLLFATCSAFAQRNVLFVQIENSDGEIFCGPDIVEMEFKGKSVKLYTEHGQLVLRRIKKNYGEYSSYKCVDEKGNVYLISDITNGDGGKGLIFEPEDDYLMTFTIANQNICED